MNKKMDTPERYTYKNDVLINYLQTIGKTPAQKSPEWYAIKEKTIGGSEVATVLGINPYKKVKDLVAEKIGLQTFYGSSATRWGNVFEPVTNTWAQIILKMGDTIKEGGSIEGVIERQRYSPDGLGVVKLKAADGTYEYYIVLFEFKAPYSKFPNGSIPKHYLPQILTGLMNIPAADLCIFVNNCYRKCALNDLNFTSSYDASYHAGDYKKRKKGLEKNKVLACGIIGFYQKEENYERMLEYLGYEEPEDNGNYDYDESPMDLNIFENILNETKKSQFSYRDSDRPLLLDSKDCPIDFGLPNTPLDRILELVDYKAVHCMYFPLIINNDAVNELDFVYTHDLQRDEKTEISNDKVIAFGKTYYKRFVNKCSEKNYWPVGILPWKLLASDIITENPDENWRNHIEEKITQVIKTLDDIHATSDKEKRFYELFPCKDGMTSDELEESAFCSNMLNAEDDLEIPVD